MGALGRADVVPGRREAWSAPAHGVAARILGERAEDVQRAHRRPAHVPADVALWPVLTGQECIGVLPAVGGHLRLVLADSFRWPAGWGTSRVPAPSGPSRPSGGVSRGRWS